MDIQVMDARNRANAYTTNLRNSFYFLSQVVQTYDTKILQGKSFQAHTTQVSDIKSLECTIDSFESMKSHLRHAIVEIGALKESAVNLFGKMSEDSKRDLEEVYRSIIESSSAVVVLPKAKEQLAAIEYLLLYMKESLSEAKLFLQLFETETHKRKAGVLLDSEQQLPRTTGSQHYVMKCVSEQLFEKIDEEDVDQKMKMLYRSASGRTLSTIDVIKRASEIYQRLSILLEKENSKFTSDELVMKCMDGIETAANRSSECMSVFRQMKIVLGNLEAAGYVVTSTACYHVAAQKFPPFIMETIHLETSANLTVSNILESISRNIRKLQKNELRKSWFAHMMKHSQGRTDPQIVRSQPSSISMCTFCENAKHDSYECTLIDTVEGRKDILRKKNACWLCFSSTHETTGCKKPKCRICKDNHHELICLLASTSENGRGVKSSMAA